MRPMNLGEEFIAKVELLYTDSIARVIVNGKMRQGTEGGVAKMRICVNFMTKDRQPRTKWIEKKLRRVAKNWV